MNLIFFDFLSKLLSKIWESLELTLGKKGHENSSFDEKKENLFHLIFSKKFNRATFFYFAFIIS